MIKLDATVIGTQPIDITWFQIIFGDNLFKSLKLKVLNNFRLRDGTEIDLSNDTNFSAVYDEEDGFVELTCLAATSKHVGKYKCQAKNSVGKMTIECDVIEGGVKVFSFDI